MIKNLLIAAFSLCFFPVSAAVPDIPSLDDLAGAWNPVSDLRSLPAINSPKGAAKTTDNLLGVSCIDFPPIFLSGVTGILKIDGAEVKAREVRWYPYQVLRRATVGKNLDLESSVRMAPGGAGVLMEVSLRNNAAQARSLTLRIDLGGLPVALKMKEWGNPESSDATGFLVTTKSGQLVIRHPHRNLALAYAFSTPPDFLVPVAKGEAPSWGRATWKMKLAPGETRKLTVVLASSPGTDPAATSLRLARDPSSGQRAKAEWENRWHAMFEPGNPLFSGSLPTLITPDAAVQRVYYMSLVSMLSIYRDCFALQPRVYVSASPEYGCTLVYFWDTREWATVFALLDPQTLRKTLLDWFSLGIQGGYAEDYLSGKLVGPFYSANHFSVLLQAVTYIAVTGDLAFLDEKVRSKTILQHLNETALFWKSLVRPGRRLADYGGASNLLECVPTYINEVPSLNAADIWMMRRIAAIDEMKGNPQQAQSLRADADALLPEVLALYEPGHGVWDSLHRDGARVPMRHVFDFATIGLTLSADLDARTRQDMENFVKKELLTDTWMRAQSLQDIAAAQSDRPDHGPMGAFSAWPAETIAVFCKFGDYRDALDLLHRVAAVTTEGPFSQSRELLGNAHDAKARIAFRGEQTYNVSSGASFAESIIRNLFGFNPEVETENLPAALSDTQSRGFTGELKNVRFHGALYDITLDHRGRRVIRQKAGGKRTAEISSPKHQTKSVRPREVEKGAALPSVNFSPLIAASGP